MKKLILSALAAATLVGTNISAVQAEKINPWRDCGIGALIFPSVPAGAVISNIIWDLGTTAVTSNASSPDTCEGETVKVAQFIQETFKPLEEETANGSGEHVTAMLNILGCEENVHNSIIKNVRLEYATKLESTEDTQKPQALYNAVIHNTADVCSAS
ncbi:DUF3015 family protein [Catenovulum sediminis]|uniref:DUF3015 family protein n=1 Tax=Catenovulum sediminis TaxID=1740262 RepID=A0ABV1RF54_9ALTE|nr:DUF3015 family protein [Catenovulum sediminis]